MIPALHTQHGLPNVKLSVSSCLCKLSVWTWCQVVVFFFDTITALYFFQAMLNSFTTYLLIDWLKHMAVNFKKTSSQTVIRFKQMYIETTVSSQLT